MSDTDQFVDNLARAAELIEQLTREHVQRHEEHLAKGGVVRVCLDEHDGVSFVPIAPTDVYLTGEEQRLFARASQRSAKVLYSPTSISKG